MKRILCLVLSLFMGGANFTCLSKDNDSSGLITWGTIVEEKPYVISEKLNQKIKKTYNSDNFSTAWGIYDISGANLKEVASYNVEKSFQSNCTIKAMMLLYVCKLLDEGSLALNDKLTVNKNKLHYTDFNSSNGRYSVEYLLGKMIHESNNVCYEVFLRYVTKESFNSFLKSLGSGTQITSYNYMGNAIPKDRAIEWFHIYNYCHSKGENASFAWNLFKEAKYSPIRDGLGVKVAHKSGWYYKKGTCGTAADCAIIKTKNGGAYLMVIFTKRNSAGNFSKTYIANLACVLNEVWDEYYAQLLNPKTAIF